MDTCFSNKPNQTNCLMLNSRKVNDTFVKINPNNNATCIHEWKNCGNDLKLSKNAINSEWTFKNDNLCSMDFIQIPEYEYCKEDNHTYFNTDLSSQVKQVELTSETNKPDETNVALNLNQSYVNVREENKIYETQIVNYRWMTDGELLSGTTKTLKTYTKSRRKVSYSDNHYYGGWKESVKCDTHRSKYTCEEGFKIIGNGCNSENTIDGYVPRVQDGLENGNGTTEQCRCIKEEILDSQDLKCPKDYLMDSSTGNCIFQG
jgi:hypothetical protein